MAYWGIGRPGRRTRRVGNAPESRQTRSL